MPSTSQNASSNNVFFIASISNVCSVSSIIGTNVITVNPVPTSTLLNAGNFTKCIEQQRLLHRQHLQRLLGKLDHRDECYHRQSGANIHPVECRQLHKMHRATTSSSSPASPTSAR